MYIKSNTAYKPSNYIPDEWDILNTSNGDWVITRLSPTNPNKRLYIKKDFNYGTGLCDFTVYFGDTSEIVDPSYEAHDMTWSNPKFRNREESYLDEVVSYAENITVDALKTPPDDVPDGWEIKDAYSPEYYGRWSSIRKVVSKNVSVEIRKYICTKYEVSLIKNGFSSLYKSFNNFDEALHYAHSIFSMYFDDEEDYDEDKFAIVVKSKNGLDFWDLERPVETALSSRGCNIVSFDVEEDYGNESKAIIGIWVEWGGKLSYSTIENLIKKTIRSEGFSVLRG